MKNRVITISREFGSGGRTIGKKAAQALGIPCYDQELIQKIAAQSGFHEGYVQDAGEDSTGGFLASPLPTTFRATAMPTTSGRSSIRSSPIWPRKGPA